MKEIIDQYTDYHVWANERMIRFLSQQDDQLLRQSLTSSFATIEKTVFHMWDAETIWLKRLHGESLDYWPSKGFEGDLGEVWKGWLEKSGELRDYAKGLSEVELHEFYEYHNTKGSAFRHKRFETIVHVVNHGTYHRGQLVTMARQAGITEGIPATDLVVFQREQV